jgi:ribosomal protein S18 acetylase RimI-like enzyme
VIVYRKCIKSDVPHLYRTDLKSFETSWTFDEWERIPKDFEVMSAVFYQTVVGFAVYGLNEPGTGLDIVKLAVKPPVRRRGIASGLVVHISQHARSLDLGHIGISVPESWCVPGHRCMEFLKHRAFIGRSVIPDAFEDCGHKEDGFYFTRSTC